MTIVLDASAVVAVLTGGAGGRWARTRMRGQAMLAPHLMPVEVTQGLRRLVASGGLEEPDARRGVQALGDWPVTLLDFAPFADRVWELRDTVSSYDAWYVAIAEAAEAPLVTLDARLARASGTRCVVEVAPS